MDGGGTHMYKVFGAEKRQNLNSCYIATRYIRCASMRTRSMHRVRGAQNRRFLNLAHSMPPRSDFLQNFKNRTAENCGAICNKTFLVLLSPVTLYISDDV